jgi:uncharacterized protein YqeY
MSVREQIMADVKSAMKNKETEKLNTLRFVQSAIKNREIELRPNPMTDDEALGVLKKLVKQRKESIEQYQAAGREDLVANESAELKIIESYLPAQMERAQVDALVREVIAQTGAKTVKEMGAVMKEVIARSQGRADNKMISELVKAALN